MTGASGPTGGPEERDGAIRPDTGSSPLLVCLKCGFTYAEFRARGLLGCPACYDHFGETLRAEMLHVHPGLHKLQARAENPPDASGEDTAALRERLSDALRFERYEEAAALKRKLHRKLQESPEADGEVSP